MLLSVFLDYSCSNSTCNLPLENNLQKSQRSYIEKFQYIVFLLNTTGCTLMFPLVREKLGLSDLETLSITTFDNHIYWFIWGIIMVIVSMIIEYISIEREKVYANHIRSYKELQLRNLNMFQDFIQGTNYCSHFSPYTKESYADNLKKLQTRLAYYEILREANYRNLELAQHLNYIALWLCILSYSFFYLGLQGFSFTSAYYQHWYYLTSVIVPFLIGLYIIKKIIECAKIVDMRETEYRTIKETYEQNTGVN